MYQKSTQGPSFFFWFSAAPWLVLGVIAMERREAVRLQGALELCRDPAGAMIEAAAAVHEDDAWLRPAAAERRVHGGAQLLYERAHAADVVTREAGAKDLHVQLPARQNRHPEYQVG